MKEPYKYIYKYILYLLYIKQSASIYSHVSVREDSTLINLMESVLS